MRIGLGFSLLLLCHSVYANQPNHKSNDSVELQTLKKQILASPNDATLRLKLIESYVQLGHFNAALTELDKIKQTGAKLEVWGMWAAKIYMGLDKPKEAVAVLNELGDKAEKSSRLLLLGDAYMMQKKFKEASEQFQDSSLSQNPKAHLGLTQIALYENQKESAQKHLTQAIALADKSDKLFASQLHNVQAEIYRISQVFDKAEIEYKNALTANPNNISARLNYTAFLLAKKDTKAFVAQANALYKILPRQQMAMYYQAVALLQENNVESAYKILESAVKLYPNFPDNYLLLARSNFENGQYLVAEQNIKTYIHLKPNNLIATKLLAAIYIRLNRVSEALALLQPLEKTNQEDASYLSLYGTALLLNHQLAKAEEILSKAQKFEQDNPVVATELALSHLGQGEIAAAESLLQKIVDAKTDYIQADILLVLSLIQSKSYTKAEIVAKNIITKKPDHPAPYNLLAMVYEQEKKFDLAKENYLAALKRDPNFALSQNNLSELYLSQEKYDDALSNIQDTLNKNPEDLRALILMGFLKDKTGKKEEALSWYQKAKTNFPNEVAPRVQVMNYHIRAADAVKANIEADHLYFKFPKNPEVLARVSELKILLGKHEEALKIYQDWQSADKTNPYIDFMLAKLSLVLNKDKNAQSYLEQALAKDPKYVPALVLQTQIYINQRDVKNAQRVANEVMALAKDKDFSYLLQGKVSLLTQSFAEAVQYFKKAYDLTPNFENVTALFDGLNASQKTEEAFSLIESWIKSHPNHVGVRRFIALQAMHQGLPKKAIKYYEEILQLTKGDFVTFNNLASLYLATNIDKAHDFAQKAYEAAPDHPKVIDTLGWILTQKKLADKALPLLEQAHKLSPDELDIQYHLAVALYELGSKNEALRLLKGSIESNKPFAEKNEAENFYKKINTEIGQL